MAGAVIAASAAQAAALGLACMRISRDLFSWDSTAHQRAITRMDELRAKFLQWSAKDATAIARFVELREAGRMLEGQQLLCQAPLTVGQLAVSSAEICQTFRPHVHERVRDDLEMSISLLSAAARAALLLLDSNLRIWPDPPLQAEFSPAQQELAEAIDSLTPKTRILD